MLYPGIVSSQEVNRIIPLSFISSDSITLRWAPSSLAIWQAGIRWGYVIKRYTIVKNGVFISDGLSRGEVLTETPLKPASPEFFSSLALKDKRSEIVADAIYNMAFDPAVGNDFKSFSEVHEELEIRLGFALLMCDLSPLIASAAGLIFTDRDITNDRYVYSISLANVPDGLETEPAVIVAGTDEITMLPAVTDISSLFLDRKVKFRWPVTFLKGVYTAYTVEKSADKKTWIPISDLPLFNLFEEDNPEYFTYTDSLDNNDIKYYYRVKGISPFGMEGPYSLLIEGKGTPEFSAYATIDTVYNLKGQVEILWRISEDHGFPVKDISLLRSDRYNGEYTRLNTKPLSSKTRSFKDVKPLLSNYYQVKLTGGDNLISLSFPYYFQTEDNAPPAVPSMLAGTIDSTGVVSLVWKLNNEPDIMGYKVFRGNNTFDEFIPLSGVIEPDNFCYDTINLNTLSTTMCYKVIAVDKNYNSSGYSSILELSRPDTIPPSPALITDIRIEEDVVKMQFEPSPSIDIISHELVARGVKDSAFLRLGKWDDILPANFEISSFYDDINLSFYLITSDKAGNKSEYRRDLFIPKKVTGVVTLAAEESPQGDLVVLTWNHPEGFNPLKTILYRASGDSPMGIYASFPGSPGVFTDKKIERGSTYRYRILLFNSRGTAGSGIITINE